METALPNISATCFGEVLWDVLPEGAQPGGAPLNVAYHLNKLGMNAGIISRIGNDAQGKRLLGLIDNWGINSDLMQIDSHYPTSEVIARMNEHKEVSYEIVFPVAWDFITGIGANDGSKNTKYLVYGSLASRNETTRQTLFDLLESDVIKVLDINLRPPFFEPDLLKILLQKADIVKFNQAELHIVGETFGSSAEAELDLVQFIRERFNISEIIVTKGADGASYYTSTGAYHCGGVPITVEDTIGSGDALLATFIANHHRQRPPDLILKNAVAMGAFIATKKGGCPDYDIPEYEHFNAINFQNL